MNTITKWTGIALLSLAPVMASAQQQEQPITPFNNAAITPNNLLTMALSPGQVGTTMGISDVQATFGALGSYSTSLSGSLRVGGSMLGTVSLTYKGAKTNMLVPVVGAELTTKTGKFSIGAKLPFTGKNKTLEAGQLSALLLYTNQFGDYTGKFSSELSSGSQNYQKSATIIAELIKGGTGVSANLKLSDKVKAKLSVGIEQSLGKGWQVGASLHPETSFFKGKLNPNFEITKKFPFGRVTGYYSPQTKTVNATVRLNY